MITRVATLLMVGLALLHLAGAPHSVIAQIPTVPLPPSAEGGESVDTISTLYSPRGAFFRSLLLPGWGQAYVGSPVRGAVYFTLASGGVWMSYVARRQLADARREQYWLRQTGQIDETAETDIVLSREQQFEDWAALSLFIFFFAGADAYVSAYLADFSDRVGVRPGADGELRLEATIPLGGP